MIERTLVNLLDETIQALALLDLNRLQLLEEEAAAFSRTRGIDRGEGIDSILTRKYLLAVVLDHCGSHLNALNLLHGRNTREQWAR